MLKDLAKLILTSKAALDIVKEKVESKAVECLVQLKQFTDKSQSNSSNGQNTDKTCKLKEKAKEELFQLLNEITHRTQINESQLRGFIKDKLTELTNNALLDSTELNDIRSEIASLRAEISDLKSELQLIKR